jgi:hypothetical protein
MVEPAERERVRRSANGATEVTEMTQLAVYIPARHALPKGDTMQGSPSKVISLLDDLVA